MGALFLLGCFARAGAQNYSLQEASLPFKKLLTRKLTVIFRRAEKGNSQNADIGELIERGEPVTEATRRGGQEAIRLHIQRGAPTLFRQDRKCQDGKFWKLALKSWRKDSRGRKESLSARRAFFLRRLPKRVFVKTSQAGSRSRRVLGEGETF
jgi:hypothetical protein